MSTFLWHDYETFGLSPSMDRPAQFAAMRTDEELNICEKPMCFYCQPAADALPSAQSISITGILPQTCLKQGLKESEFAHRIHDAMSVPETISVGYNNMRFDDEVTRFMFWRNFIDPYEREYKDGCSRFDLFPLVVATWALRPEGIVWPTVQTEDGQERVSFRLEHLSVANGLKHEHAHDALSDGEATIEVARLIRSKQPRLWDYALKLRSKDYVKNLVQSGKPLVWVSPAHGHDRGYVRLVLCLGQHPARANSVLFWDLAYDPKEMLTLTAEEVKTRLFAREEDLPEGMTRLPIFTCRINQAPFLVAHMGVLSEERAQAFGSNRQEALERAQDILPHIEALTSLWLEALGDGGDSPKTGADTDVDAALYSGFPSFTDKQKVKRVSITDPQALAQAVFDGRVHFDDVRLNEMLFRYRARNWPETLNESEREQWHALREARLVNGEGGARTLEQFAEEIALLEEQKAESMTEADEELFGALYDWAEVMSDSLES